MSFRPLPPITLLPRSKNERLGGIRPSIWAQLRHVTKQLSPDWNFILRWVASGTFALTALTIIAFAVLKIQMESANREAKNSRAAHTAEVQRKAKKLVEAEELHQWEVHARGNWDVWKSQFTSDADGIACAHGHTLNSYEILCQLGPKGHIPTTQVICNQNICRVVAPTPTKDKQ